jgi:predicted NUDIX family phosphoesterase
MEEVAIGEEKDVAVGLINDDETDVGYVHFGVVHIMFVSDESVAGRRSGIVSPEFVPITDAIKDLSSYESWSRFCLENFESLLNKAAEFGLSETAAK